MSYARFGEGSDVYVFLSVSGELECCGCLFGQSWTSKTTDGMVAHLREHEAAGHEVPEHLIPWLETDREENDEFMAAEPEKT